MNCRVNLCVNYGETARRVTPMVEMTLPEAFAVLGMAHKVIGSTNAMPEMLAEIERIVTSSSNSELGRLSEDIAVSP